MTTITLMILLAFFNGFLIVLTRVVNARLGTYISSPGSSIWNHFVGFLFLMAIIPFLDGGLYINFKNIPVYLFLGGIIGAGYVAINNWVLPKVGVTKTTVLVIGGQIVCGTLIDFFRGYINQLNYTLIGIFLVILGMWVGSRK